MEYLDKKKIGKKKTEVALGKLMIGCSERDNQLDQVLVQLLGKTLSYDLLNLYSGSAQASVVS